MTSKQSLTASLDGKQMMSPFVSDDRQWICYPFGTRVSVRQLMPNTRNRRPLQLKAGVGRGPDGRLDHNRHVLFVGHFPLDESELEVSVDNTDCKRDIEYTIKLTQNYLCTHYLRAGDHWEHKSIEPNGYRLHVKSQSLRSTQRLLDRIAERREVDTEEAARGSSVIWFTVRVEQPFELLAEPMRLYVRHRRRPQAAQPPEPAAHNPEIEYPFEGNEGVDKLPKYIEGVNSRQIRLQDFYEITIGADNTVQQLKRRIHRLEGIAVRSQKLMRSHRLMFDMNTLRSYGVTNNSIVDLYPRLLGGCPLTEDVLAGMYGPRGIICLNSHTTDQGVPEVNHEFIADPTLDVMPFVVELRYDPYI